MLSINRVTDSHTGGLIALHRNPYRLGLHTLAMMVNDSERKTN